MSRRWRAYVPDLAADAPPGLEVPLPADEAHHLVNVLRLRAGETVALFDGRGHEWSASLIDVGRRHAVARLGGSIDDVVESPLTWSLFQGPCRPDRMDWVVQKSTELGVASVTGVDPGSRGGPGRVERRRLRWARVAVEAAKQSGRRVVPTVEAAAEWPDPGPGVLALVCDPTPGAPSLRERLDGPRPDELWLAVGPEDGFTPAALANLVGRGWLPAGLGPRVLRTETAGPVAAAIALHRWADLGS